MAYVLKIDNGITADVINFMSSDYLLQDGGLVIGTPDKTQIFTEESAYKHGSDIVASSYKNREIKVVFQTTGATRDELIDNVNRLTRVLEKARNDNIAKNSEVTQLVYSWDGATSTNYFKIIDGSLLWPEDVMSVDQVHQNLPNGDYVIYGFELTLVAYPFSATSPYDGSSLVSIPLTNGNGTDVTSGLLVFNHNDSGTGHDNYALIDGDDVPGDQPGLLKLTVDSYPQGKLSGSYSLGYLSRVHVGILKNSTFTGFFLDDTDSFHHASLSHVANTYCAGGTYGSIAVSSTSAVRAIWWGIDSADVEALNSPCKVFAITGGSVFGGSDGFSKSCSYRLVASAALADGDGAFNTYNTYYGEWVVPSDNPIGEVMLLDLGIINVPHGFSKKVSAPSPMSIGIEIKSNTGSSYTTRIDGVLLMPVRDGYRVIDSYNIYDYTIDGYVVDDGVNDIAYLDGAGDHKFPGVYTLLRPLELEPGNDYTLVFLFEGTDVQTTTPGDPLIMADKRCYVSVQMVPQFTNIG